MRDDARVMFSRRAILFFMTRDAFFTTRAQGEDRTVLPLCQILFSQLLVWGQTLIHDWGLMSEIDWRLMSIIVWWYFVKRDWWLTSNTLQSIFEVNHGLTSIINHVWQKIIKQWLTSTINQFLTSIINHQSMFEVKLAMETKEFDREAKQFYLLPACASWKKHRAS